MYKPAHPGKISFEDFLKPLSISVSEAAEVVGISQKHLFSIINGSESLTVDSAARIRAFTNTSARMWLGIQNNYDHEY